MVTFWVAVVALLGCSTPPQEIPCVDLPRVDRAVLLFPGAQGLGAGTWDLRYSAGDQAETCTITVGALGPSDATSMPGMVRGPTTQTSSTCNLVEVSGMNDDGSVGALDVKGTPPKFKVEIAQGDRLVGSVEASPDYTPDRCGFVQPHVELPLSL